MFEHLLDPVFDEVADLPAPAIVSAQINTADWLTDHTIPTIPATSQDAHAARQAFEATLHPELDPETRRRSVMELRSPEAVRHLVGMLSAYDWKFVEQAQELRGYVVAKLLEETKHPDARIRLRALELTGKLTEVSSFTERVEITRKDESADAIEDRIRAKLKQLLPPTMEVQDAEIKEIAVVPHAKPTDAPTAE